MASICANPYCPDPEKGVRPPTCEEMERVRGELDRDSLDRLNRNEITLQVCVACGTWVAEAWDNHRNTLVRQFIASPFKFTVGDRVKVLEGERHSMAGIVTRRMRWAKTMMPPPPPENVYFVVFDDSTEHGYGEASLIGVKVGK